jgi:2-oxo-3-hexenedioate decarboxylase/2-keto-4-pentenoate hydratase
VTLTTAEVRTAAELLATARRSAELFDRLPDDLRPADERDAYRIQEALGELLNATGRSVPRIHKIGCTTAVMQEYMGIDSPCAGNVVASGLREREGSFACPPAGRLGVECEIAVVLGADLPPRTAGYDRAAVTSAVAACCAAIEVVEDRYVDYPSLDTPTLIADDFFAHGAVLGEPDRAFPAVHLDGVSARMTVNGAPAGEGVGADILGHPLEALAWLADLRARSGLGLRRGEVVLLGSVVQTCWVGRGDVVSIENDPLGTVVARFS